MSPAPLWVSAVEGTILLGLGLWLAPRVMREHLTPKSDPELAALVTEAKENSSRALTGLRDLVRGI